MRNAGAAGSSICPTTARPLDDRSPPTGERSTKADDVAPSPSSAGGSTPNAAIAARDARSAARASPAADSASCTSRSGTIFSAARPRLRSSAASASFSRALADRYSARSRAELWTRQLRKRLAGRTASPALTSNPRDPRRHRRADLGVGALVHRELAQEHDKVPAGARFDGAGGNSKVTQHALVDFDGVGVLLCARPVRRRWMLPVRVSRSRPTYGRSQPAPALERG